MKRFEALGTRTYTRGLIWPDGRPINRTTIVGELLALIKFNLCERTRSFSQGHQTFFFITLILKQNKIDKLSNAIAAWNFEKEPSMIIEMKEMEQIFSRIVMIRLYRKKVIYMED